jgi:hypothetical protein
MIYVATVHYKSDKWIDVQLAYLRRNLREPFRVVSCLEDIPEEHEQKFYKVVPAVGAHAGKLNLLAAEILAEAEPDDLIMFLDGDAFPIADPMPFVHRSLETSVLVAVRRDENGGDPQPHPCFCVIRVGDWRRLCGDWSPGHYWFNSKNWRISDPGGNLLATLQRESEPWTPLLRSNTTNLNPVSFGVYGSIVYHHGAGFRMAEIRGVIMNQPERLKAIEQIPILRYPVRKITNLRIKSWKKMQIEMNHRIGDDIFTQIKEDPNFSRTLDDKVAEVS